MYKLAIFYPDTHRDRKSNNNGKNNTHGATLVTTCRLKIRWANDNAA